MAQTALITGASEGIGLELARVFAAHGHNTILVARQETKLHELAAELVETHGIAATVIAQDLAAPEAAAHLVAEVEQRGLPVDILVNNAGLGLYGPFIEQEVAAILHLLQVNVVALTALTRLLLPAMVARRHGKILNVASTAAFQAGPRMAIYYASKAFVLSFSEALAEELSGSGIVVSALCPGPVATQFQQRAGVSRKRRISRYLRPMSARQVAEAGFAGLQRQQRVIIPGIGNKLQVQLVRWAPRRLVTHIAGLLQRPADA